MFSSMDRATKICAFLMVMAGASYLYTFAGLLEKLQQVSVLVMTG